MKKVSVKLRVTLWYTLVMIIVSAIVLITMASINKKIIERDACDRLIETVEESTRFAGHAKNPPPHDFKFYKRGVHMAFFDEKHELIGGQLPFGTEEEAIFKDGKLRNEIYGGEEYFIFDKKIYLPEDNAVYWIKGAISVSSENYAVGSVMHTNLIVCIVLIIIAALGGYFIISKAFVPVKKIRHTAEEIIKSTDLSRRINIGKGKDEIYSLANTFDAMLEKIEKTFEREKQFTSDASHELRTPVAVIMSECEYMAECAENIEEFKESADSVKRQAEKMSKLISELLTISRMDMNTQRMNVERTDISELLNFVCDEQEEIQNAEIKLERNIVSGIYADVDRFLIARLFINLISNAYQYSNEQGKITVELRKESGKIVFMVTDEGIGIDQKDIPKIWERFYQVDSARTPNNNGSMGLGLSMVKWIAEKHNGKVYVESEIGKGSCFTFEFI